MTRARSLCVVAAVLAACGAPPHVEDREDSRLQYSAPDPSESRPIRQGFTHRPPPDTPGLPAPPPPLLTEEDGQAALAASARMSETERERAEAEIVDLVERFDRTGSLEEGEGGLRRAVVERLRTGRLKHFTADGLFARYLFPNEASADAELKDRLVVVTGTVAPHSMLDHADGFKVFDQVPYVQEPVLLATVYDVSFVRCVLARPELQKLRDWEEVHLVGVVSGKERTDVVLRRCVVVF